MADTIDTVNPWRVVLVGIALGCVPLWLEAPQLFRPGVPYPVDGASNLLPPLHARYSLAQGQLPIYTELWYGGEYQFVNPLWKGFYPPAWPLFIPGIPFFPALKAVLALHYIAPVAIAYWYARQDFSPWIAVPFALVFVLPMALFGGMYEKVLAWPWVVLIGWQLTPPRLLGRPRRAGILAGIGLGVVLLAGDVYAFFYTSCFVGVIVLALRTEAIPFVRGALLGGLVGVPKIVLSIVPTMLGGANRPPVGFSVSLREAIGGLAGFWIDRSGTVLVDEVIFRTLGYRVVGLPVLVLGACAIGYAYVRPPDRHYSRWLLGVSGAGLVGLLLASGWTFLYDPLVPVTSIFRLTARALLITALAALLCAWYALSVTTDHGSALVTAGVSVLLVLSVMNGAVAWQVVDDTEWTEPSVGERVAETVDMSGCGPVWIETAYRKQPVPEDIIAFALTERGIPVAAMHYGRSGWEYAVRENGHRTFDSLVTGAPLPERGMVSLYGEDVSSHGRIDASRFDLIRTFSSEGGPVYLYAADSC